MAKLGVALTTAETGQPEISASANGGLEHHSKEADPLTNHFVRPLAFKSLVGKGHTEFSSGRQQVQSTLMYMTKICCSAYGMLACNGGKLHDGTYRSSNMPGPGVFDLSVCSHSITTLETRTSQVCLLTQGIS